MPRPPSRLTPADGPLARFALELRALRDTAGFAAPSVDQIATRTGIARSTLYAALRGQRLPTRPALSALVTQWGGSETEWLTRRTETEAALQALRAEGEAAPRAAPAPPTPAASPAERPTEPETATPVKKYIVNKEVDEAVAEDMREWLRGVRLRDAESQTMLQEMGTQLQALRARAGAPTLRQLSDQIRESDFPGTVGVATLSTVFNGKQLPKWTVLRVIVEVLGGDAEQWRDTWVRIKAIRDTLL
ncbi:helix-turn-helix transcriptional regulator [Streptomyces sp. Root1310]|uniref:helix-turn-helix domain-containing protein n=1 Tax=Streptomyces sp. Root1310 TaxID=1736452 RepID=UPI000A4C2C8B|nr:helix-turn-helix transcriptional regulator [Streptomyces sp. Root1310]